MSVAFSACSDDVNYEEGPASSGAFISNDAPSTIVLSKKDNQSSFSIEICRAGVTEAASYPVVVTVNDPEGVFTLPSSVSFAQGQTVADLVIGCDLDKAEYDSSYKFDVTFGQGTPLYAYGKSVYSFTASIPAAWSAWSKFGVGTLSWFYDLSFLMSGEDPGLPVYARQNQVNTNMYELWIQHWANDVDLYLTWDSTTGIVTVPFGQSTGIWVNSNTYEVFFTDIATYAEATGINNPFPEYPSFYNPETGFLAINAMYYSVDEEGPFPWQGSYGGYETAQLDGFADYSVNVAYKGLFTSADEESYAVLTTYVGDGYTSGKVAISNTLNPDQILAEIIANPDNAASVAQGNDEVQLPLSGSGNYNAVIVGYNGNEAGENVATITFNIAGGGTVSEHSWKHYGTGAIIDGWFTYPWGFQTSAGQEIPYDEIVWSFDVEYDALNKGVYRLVNVWGSEDCPLVYLDINECTKERNIILDCSNPEYTIWTPQLSGFKSSRFGGNLTDELFAANVLGYYAANEGLTIEDFEEAGYTCPVEDDMIYFESCLFGPSVEECSYNWRDDPYGMIALKTPEDNGMIAKKITRNRDLKDRYKVAGIMRHFKANSMKALEKNRATKKATKLVAVPFRF